MTRRITPPTYPPTSAFYIRFSILVLPASCFSKEPSTFSIRITLSFEGFPLLQMLNSNVDMFYPFVFRLRLRVLGVLVAGNVEVRVEECG